MVACDYGFNNDEDIKIDLLQYVQVKTKVKNAWVTVINVHLMFL